MPRLLPQVNQIYLTSSIGLILVLLCLSLTLNDFWSQGLEKLGQIVPELIENVLGCSAKIGSWVKNTHGLIERRSHQEREGTGD